MCGILTHTKNDVNEHGNLEILSMMVGIFDRKKLNN